MIRQLRQLPVELPGTKNFRIGMLRTLALIIILINGWVLWRVSPLLSVGLSIAYALLWGLLYRRHYYQTHRYDFTRHVMDSMGQGLTITNATGVFEYVNTAFARMVGRTADELVGTVPESIIHPEDAKEMQIGHELRQQGLSNRYEIRLRRADGSYIYVLITGVPRWDQGRVNGAIAVITDLTERQQLEETMRKARDQAVEAARMKSEFLATMSHEIRTPMNGILGMSELLLETGLTDEQREFANIVQSEANSLLKIINDILDFSKIESGKMVLESTELVLVDMIGRITEAMTTQIRGRDLRITHNVAPEIPFTIKGDPTRLRQILLNLVGNAVKFTSDGEITISVIIDRKTENGLMLRFAVSDTGIGISESLSNHLFEPFTQADSSTTRKYGGTGLGLAICRRLTELMGGEIGVKSVEGHGSTFWFTAHFDMVNSPQTIHSSQTIANGVGKKTSPLSQIVAIPMALVVDDDPLSIVHTRHHLERLNYLVEVASSGQIALDMLAALPDRYSVALMDCDMPQMDGFETTRRLRNRETHRPQPRLPVIAMTNRSAAEDQERCDQAGMDAVLSKPLKFEQLQRELRYRVLPQWD
ncbi:MAG: ATP-binding protein [Anaerolineae bacterium]